METRITKANMLAILDTFSTELDALSQYTSMHMEGRKWQLAADDASVMICAGNFRVAAQIIKETGLLPLWEAALCALKNLLFLTPEDVGRDVMGMYVFEYELVLYGERTFPRKIIKQEALNAVKAVFY